MVLDPWFISIDSHKLTTRTRNSSHQTPGLLQPPASTHTRAQQGGSPSMDPASQWSSIQGGTRAASMEDSPSSTGGCFFVSRARVRSIDRVLGPCVSECVRPRSFAPWGTCLLLHSHDSMIRL